MAQASSAQREPSMEEILASIRRIIEDSDSDKKRDDFQPTVITQPANDGLETAKDVEAFRAEFGTATMQEPAPAAEPEPVVQPPLAAVPELAPIVEPVSFQRPSMAEMVQAPRDAFAPVPEFDGQAAELTVGTVESELEALVRADVEEQQRAPEPAAEAAFAAADSAARPALMSERPGRQVAAAFEELSEAFAASRRRSFDEMAEEMLRPMLQDWLDNNLPHLVERLVREEIERIARG